MIETKKQCIEAVREIKRISGWSQREIGDRAGINHSVISRLLSKKDAVRTPTRQTREKIYFLLILARGITQ